MTDRRDPHPGRNTLEGRASPPVAPSPGGIRPATGVDADLATLRVAVACKFDCSEHEPTQDALARVEAELSRLRALADDRLALMKSEEQGWQQECDELKAEATRLREQRDALDDSLRDAGQIATMMRDRAEAAEARCARLRSERDLADGRATDYELRCARLQQALAELEDAVSGALGSMAFYFGPNARTAVSREASKRFKRIKAARDTAREALAGPDTPADSQEDKT